MRKWTVEVRGMPPQTTVAVSAAKARANVAWRLRVPYSSIVSVTEVKQ